MSSTPTAQHDRPSLLTASSLRPIPIRDKKTYRRSRGRSQKGVPSSAPPNVRTGHAPCHHRLRLGSRSTGPVTRHINSQGPFAAANGRPPNLHHTSATSHTIPPPKTSGTRPPASGTWQPTPRAAAHPGRGHVSGVREETQAAAQASESTSACSRTVCVAFSCLSGG